MIFNFITELFLKGDKPTETFIGFWIVIAFFAFVMFVLASLIGVTIGDAIVGQIEKKLKKELKIRYQFLIVILNCLYKNDYKDRIIFKEKVKVFSDNLNNFSNAIKEEDFEFYKRYKSTWDSYFRIFNELLKK